MPDKYRFEDFYLRQDIDDDKVMMNNVPDSQSDSIDDDDKGNMTKIVPECDMYMMTDMQ